MEHTKIQTEERDRGYNKYIVTIFLLIVNVLIYIYTYFTQNDYYLTGGMNYDCIVEGREYYRFLTSMFLHADITHIAMNMIALVSAGTLVESYLGSLKIAIIYFVSGLGGSVLSLLVHSSGDMVYSIGASGAIFGLLVASSIIQSKKTGGSLVRAIGFVIAYAVLTWSDGIDLTGHIGGAIAGAVAAVPCSMGFAEEYREKKAATVAGTIITVIITVLSVINILRKVL